MTRLSATPIRDVDAMELTISSAMNLRTEIHSGDASWQEAEPLLKEVWPPAVMATRDWRDVVFAHADKRILVWDANDGLVCHAGLFFRTMMWNDQSVRVGGVGGVATARCYRGRGIASEALRLAASTFAEADLDFGLLFCERDTFEYYARLGWIEIRRAGGDRTAYGRSIPHEFDAIHLGLEAIAPFGNSGSLWFALVIGRPAALIPRAPQKLGTWHFLRRYLATLRTWLKASLPRIEYTPWSDYRPLIASVTRPAVLSQLSPNPPPRAIMPARAATAMSAAISPYSIAVAPISSRVKRLVRQTLHAAPLRPPSAHSP